jgi:hypothetical protein
MCIFHALCVDTGNEIHAPARSLVVSRNLSTVKDGDQQLMPR